MYGFRLVIGVASLTLVAGCAAGAGVTPSPAATTAASQSQMAVATRAPISTVEPTLRPTAVPTATARATVEPTPTQTPTPKVAAAQLKAACSKGTPIPEADTYAGTVHPLVVVFKDTDGAWVVDDGSYRSDGSYLFDIDVRSSGDTFPWPGPTQLIVCAGGQPGVGSSGLTGQGVKVGSCGTWQRQEDGVVGELILARDVVTVRVVVARTGKTLQSSTFHGSTPTCSDDWYGIGSPPWRIDGDDVSNAAINRYAMSVSTQKVK